MHTYRRLSGIARRTSNAMVISALMALLATTPGLMATAVAANSGPAMPLPIGAVEMTAQPNGTTYIRIKASTVPTGAKELRLTLINGKRYPLTPCTAARAAGSGAKGCVIVAANGAPPREFRAAWVNHQGRVGPEWKFWANDLGVRKSGKDRLVEGTVTQIWFSGSENTAVAVYKSLKATLKRHAAGCVKDQAVSSALTAIEKMSSKAAKSRNPYVVGASVVAATIVKADSEIFANRCKAIGTMVGDIRDTLRHARKSGSAKRIYLASMWGEWNNLPDHCVVYSSSGGRDGDGSSGTTTSTRPPSSAGPNKSECLGFWNSMVS